MELIVLLCALTNANDCREQHIPIPVEEPSTQLPHNCDAFKNAVMPSIMERLPKRRVSRWSCRPVEKHEEAI